MKSHCKKIGLHQIMPFILIFLAVIVVVFN